MANLRCVAGVYDSKQLSDDQISCILGPHDVYDGSSIISWPKTVVVALVRSWTLVGQNKTTGSGILVRFKKIVAMSRPALTLVQGSEVRSTQDGQK